MLYRTKTLWEAPQKNFFKLPAVTLSSFEGGGLYFLFNSACHPLQTPVPKFWISVSNFYAWFLPKMKKNELLTLWQKYDEIKNVGTGICRGGGMLIRIKNKDLSSFKTLGAYKFGNFIKNVKHFFFFQGQTWKNL